MNIANGETVVRLFGVARRDPSLKKIAAIEARSILRNAKADIWSHAFYFRGCEFLMSTRVQAAREVMETVRTANAAGRPLKKILPPRLVVEVEAAPAGLRSRTLMRRQQMPA